MFLYTILAGIIATIFVILFVIVKKKCSNNWNYKFYNNKLICNESFMRKKIKEIQYAEVREVRYNQSFLQSRFNLGDIYIQTNNKNIFKRVVVLKSITNVEKEYERIVKIFNT